MNWTHFSLIGYAIGTFPKNIAPRGACFGAPNTNVDGQLAKNWMIKEKLRVKFAMDFFDLFNHPNFNSANLESAGFTSSSRCLLRRSHCPNQGRRSQWATLQRNQ